MAPRDASKRRYTIPVINVTRHENNRRKKKAICKDKKEGHRKMYFTVFCKFGINHVKILPSLSFVLHLARLTHRVKNIVLLL